MTEFRTEVLTFISLVCILHFTFILFARYLCNFVCYNVTYRRFKLLFDCKMTNHEFYVACLPRPVPACMLCRYSNCFVFSQYPSCYFVLTHACIQAVSYTFEHVCCAALFLKEFVVVSNVSSVRLQCYVLLVILVLSS